MIKVLFFIPNLAHGGAERVMTNLVNHLDYSRFDITVQTMFDVGIYKDKLNKNIKYIGGIPWYFRGNTLVYKCFSPKQLYKMYIKDEYDVIISYLEGPSARVIAGCPNKDTKLICWLHTELKGTDASDVVFRSTRESELCYERYYKIVGVSKTVCESFHQLYPQCKHPITIYNTVETDVISEKALEDIVDVHYDAKKINLVTTGKLIKVKGFDRLIRIVRRLLDSKLLVHLYIVGSGEEKTNLEELIKNLGLQEDVTLVGFKENPYKYVKNADLFVCSSIREGFSTAVTEALIVGTAVISTNCSGTEELLGENNEYGVITDNNEDALFDGIKRLLTEKGLLDYYKTQSKIRGEKFSMKETVEAVESLIEEVVTE